jgi:hypothetical protein
MRAGFAPLAVCALLPALLCGCASRYFRDAGEPPAPPPRHALARLPQPEHWTGIVFNGAKIGFTHTRVVPAAEPGLYEIHGEAVMLFRFLGIEKRMHLRSLDTVDENAKLVRFDYRYGLDDSEKRIEGEIGDGRLHYQVTGAQRAPEKGSEPLGQALYPAGALALLPVLHGLKIGSEFRWLVFNGETQSLNEVAQRIEAYETSELFEGAAFRVRTDLMGLKTTTWIDAGGRPVFELGLNGVIVSALEDESTAKSYLATAALSRDDVLVQWSLIKTPLSLRDPRRARVLKIALNRPPLSDERQRCRKDSADWVCEIEASRSSSGGSPDNELKPSATVQAKDPAVRALAVKITAGQESDKEKIRTVLGWLEENIRKEPVDAFSALDVLDSRRAECQGHAYLYTAFMRSLGVPTRVVNGLVYSSEHGGFLYHSWAESFVEGSWRAVDPTFNQTEADATHIALMHGEGLSELIPLVDWVGSTRIRVLEAR